MAINPSSQYPGQVAPPSTNYPYGAARDVSSPGAGDGTPVQQAWVNDWFGFQQRVLQAAGITPSGNPDNAVASDVFNGLTGRRLGTTTFTASGTMTKNPLARRWRIRLVGGGGGSSAAPATGATEVSVSCGGGAGAYAEGVYDVTAITSLAVVVGTGGAGGTAGSTFGSDGGASSVGSLISAPGGKAGLPAGPANPPFQPVANTNSNSPTGFTIVGVSGPGAEPAVAVATNYAIGSRGANGLLGVGGSVPAINTPAVIGGGYGSGASGCSAGPAHAAVAGAAGRPGVVIIEEFT